MSFNINNKLIFIDSFQILSSSLDSLIKKFDKDDFKYLSQEFNGKVLDLVKQKEFYPFDCMSGFLKEVLPWKEKFYSLLRCKEINDKTYKHVLKVWDKFEIKTMKNYYDLYSKYDALLLAGLFEKFRNSCLKNYVL